MRVFSVGGSVRDELLGLPVADRDWVVVGATPQEMERLGYKPVGRDFPVFLHPQTREEYALARTERKVAPGYRGFTVHAAPEVTLEQDLERRDLTINSMARDEKGELIDPFGGERDLQAGVLRHVSPAFAEDPVRILRVARFAARLGFEVASETLALMRSMVEQGEADALVAERVWQEFARGLLERDPWRMLVVLSESGLLARWLPELRIAIDSVRPADEASAVVARSLGFAGTEGLSLAVRFALLLRGARGGQNGKALGSQIEAVCAKLKVPGDCRDLAVLADKKAQSALRADRLESEALMELLEASDAFRRPQRLEELMRLAEAEAFGVRGWAERPYLPGRSARLALAAAQSVDAAALAREVTSTSPRGDIAGRLRRARMDSIGAALAAGREGRSP
jgi:tRNA nucleotidyltransferase (CCA-adding enzyme)